MLDFITFSPVSDFQVSVFVWRGTETGTTEEHAAHPIGLNWQIVVKAGKRYATYFCFLPLVTN